ncbi:MAG: hypothetical protein IT555_00365 [Acetobacteraceae bacterium]|nr:hypothetical protein [Acetobacteraceae bacterium]
MTKKPTTTTAPDHRGPLLLDPEELTEPRQAITYVLPAEYRAEFGISGITLEIVEDDLLPNAGEPS